MNLQKSLLIAIVLSILSLVAWEGYWRSKYEYYKASLEDDRYLWAKERAKVETATKEDVIIIGSSRTGFNFNTHIWEAVQGIKPINLSTDGKPPGPFLDDIVYNTSFNGTIIVGITSLMWFSSKDNPRWSDAKKWADHYHNQTYAQKLGYFISKPLQRNLVMLTSSELKFYNDLDLKSLINTVYIDIDGRPDYRFKLPNFSSHDEDRNLIMFPIMTANPDFAKQIQEVWNQFLPYLPDFDVVKNEIPAIINNYLVVINDFKARGGNIIFIEHYAEDEWNKHSNRMLPRKEVWDRFVATANCLAYHFEDYEFMSKYTLPDWSHMNSEDAKSYTKDMVNQLIKDGHLTKKLTKTN